MSDALLPSANHAPPQAYLLAASACGLTAAVTVPLHAWLEPANTVMLFLLTVVLVATRLGRGPSILAAFLSVGLFDFFHVPPRWSFAVSDVQYLLTFLVMLTVALLISHLTSGLQARARQAQRAAERSKALYALARQLAGALMVEQVCEATAHFASEQLHARMRLMVPGPDKQLVPAMADQPTLEPAVALLAQATFMGYEAPVRSPRPAASLDARSAQHIADDTGMHVALQLPGSTRSRGVMVLSMSVPQAHRLQAQGTLLDALASLVAAALERLHFVNVAHATQLEINDERLRGSILSALSHDIRTPLTSLFGLADALALMQPPLPAHARDMAEAMRDQAMRLHRMVSNLLDMARLHSGQQSGRLVLRREWQPIEEVIGASIQLLGGSLKDHVVKVQLPADLPLLAIDAVLMERVFGNLIENAAKYAPPGTEIRVDVAVEGDHMLVRIRDDGPGIPEGKLPHVFDVFERGATESSVPGVGLGLSICRAIVSAHGGHIEAVNAPGGGAELRFTLPLGSPPTIEPEAPGGADEAEVHQP